MKKALLLILMLIFIVGCGKQVQEEIPIQEISSEPIIPVEPEQPVELEDVESEVPVEPEQPVELEDVESEVPVEPETSSFISSMACNNGKFNFTVSNTGDEDLQTSRISMFIKGKLFRPVCDKDVIAPAESAMCSQSYYLAVEGPTQVVLQAKMGKTIEKYAKAIDC